VVIFGYTVIKYIQMLIYNYNVNFINYICHTASIVSVALTETSEVLHSFITVVVKLCTMFDGYVLQCNSLSFIVRRRK